MLKKIVVKGFQRHQSKTIELGEHVTTIVGASDQGKSSLLRAVRWVAMNQPTGDEMINWSESRTIAKLVFDDCEVVRKKGKGVNLYLLDGSRRKAFGAGKVPDDVAAMLRLDAVNFQSQHDPHFWISDTPGKVSQELNRVVDLAVIDSSLQAADSDLRKARAAREVCEDRLTAAEKAATDLAWVPAMSQELDSIISFDERLGAVQTEYSSLLALLERLEEASQEAQDASERAEVAYGLAEACEAAWRACQERDSLSAMLEELAEAEAKAAIEVPDLGSMGEDLARLESLQGDNNKLEELLQSLEEADGEVRRWQRETMRTAEALAQIALCPTCGQPA